MHVRNWACMIGFSQYTKNHLPHSTRNVAAIIYEWSLEKLNHASKWKNTPSRKKLCHVYKSPAVIPNEWSKPTSNMADTVDNILTYCVVIWTKLLQESHSNTIDFEFLNFDIKWTIHYMYNFEKRFWLVNICWQVKWKHLFSEYIF